MFRMERTCRFQEYENVLLANSQRSFHLSSIEIAHSLGFVRPRPQAFQLLVEEGQLHFECPFFHQYLNIEIDLRTYTLCDTIQKGCSQY